MDGAQCLGTFQVGRSGIVVADQVYSTLSKGLAVHLPAALAGAWGAWVSTEKPEMRRPSRSLVALHASKVGEPVWEVVEWHLCCDSCDVVISDKEFRETISLRGMGSGDAGMTGGAKAVCCYDPWRCEVSVWREDAAIVGVRVRWFSMACEVLTREYEIGGRLHFFDLREGRLQVVDGNGNCEERSFDELFWGDREEILEELKIPEQFYRELHECLSRHGVWAEAV